MELKWHANFQKNPKIIPVGSNIKFHTRKVGRKETSASSSEDHVVRVLEPILAVTGREVGYTSTAYLSITGILWYFLRAFVTDKLCYDSRELQPTNLSGILPPPPSNPHSPFSRTKKKTGQRVNVNFRPSKAFCSRLSLSFTLPNLLTVFTHFHFKHTVASKRTCDKFRAQVEVWLSQNV